jgi:beta-lactamase superfamily II metal-dependent hydrolase
MGYEIDYLPVGEGERSGDAIAIRYGNLQGFHREQTVIVIDGGTQDSGQKLVDHVQSLYDTDIIDYAICTHPDGDHASGLTVVLEQMDVRRLYMHRPWNHAAEIRDLFKDGRITNNSLEVRIRTSLQAAHDLEQVADEQGVPIVEPFFCEATEDNALVFLGPTRDYYQSLIPDFRRTPDAKEPGASLFRKATEAIRWIAESMNIETLEEPEGEKGTSAENNSSAIFLLTLEGRYFLFTGDAGVPALTRVAETAQLYNIDLSKLSFLHVPHHGSKRNVGPTILNRIKAQNAFISASPGGEPKHPAKKVVNALKRRGTQVYATQGFALRHHYNAPVRFGWSNAVELPFYNAVED